MTKFLYAIPVEKIKQNAYALPWKGAQVQEVWFMKNKWLQRAILTVIAGGSLMGFQMPADAAQIRILPVDTAKFWAGAKFDFDVEVSQADQLKNVAVTVNGQPADKFFGKSLEKKDLGNGPIRFLSPKLVPMPLR